MPLSRFLEYDGSFQHFYNAFIGIVWGTILGTIFPYASTIDKIRESIRLPALVEPTEFDNPDQQNNGSTHQAGRQENQSQATLGMWNIFGSARAYLLTIVCILLTTVLVIAPHFDRYLQTAEEIETSLFSVKLAGGDLFPNLDLTRLHILENSLNPLSGSRDKDVSPAITEAYGRLYFIRSRFFSAQHTQQFATEAERHDGYSEHNYFRQAEAAVPILERFVVPLTQCIAAIYDRYPDQVEVFYNVFPLERQVTDYALLFSKVARVAIRPNFADPNNRTIVLDQALERIFSEASLLYGVECQTPDRLSDDGASKMQVNFQDAMPYPQIYASAMLLYANQPTLGIQILEQAGTSGERSLIFHSAALRGYEMQPRSEHFSDAFDAYLLLASLLERDRRYLHEECKNCCGTALSHPMQWLTDRISIGEYLLFRYGNNLLNNFTIFEVARKSALMMELSNVAHITANSLSETRDFFLRTLQSVSSVGGDGHRTQDLRVCLFRESSLFVYLEQNLPELERIVQHTLGMFFISDAHANQTLNRDILQHLNETYLGYATEGWQKAQLQIDREFSPSQQWYANEVATHYRFIRQIYQDQ